MWTSRTHCQRLQNKTEDEELKHLERYRNRYRRRGQKKSFGEDSK